MPAPVVELVDPAAAPVTAAVTASAAPVPAGAGDDTARWLGGAGLLVGALGLGVGGGALVSTRRTR